MVSELSNNALRQELWHPVSVHLPIALLFLAFLLKLAASVAFKWPPLAKNLEQMGRLCLFSAPAFFLLSLYLGDLAFDAIQANFQHLSEVQAHEDLAYNTLYVLVAAVFLEAISAVFSPETRYPKWAKAGVLILLGYANYCLIKTAHSGGQLVYERGAGVRQTQH